MIVPSAGGKLLRQCRAAVERAFRKLRDALAQLTDEFARCWPSFDESSTIHEFSILVFLYFFFFEFFINRLFLFFLNSILSFRLISIVLVS